MSNIIFDPMKTKIMTGGIDFSSPTREYWAALISTEALAEPQHDDFGESIVYRKYVGNGRTQKIFTYKDSKDFTEKFNGSGYYMNRNTGAVLTDDDVVTASGTAVLNTSKIVSKQLDGGTNYSWAKIFTGLGKTWTTYLDLSNAEVNNTDTIVSLESDGFVVGADVAFNARDISYIMYQEIYTDISWGTTNQNQAYVTFHNPVTKKGVTYYIGTGVGGHVIPHSAGVNLEYINVKNVNTTNGDIFQTLSMLSGTGQYLQVSDAEAVITEPTLAQTSTITDVTMSTHNAVNGAYRYIMEYCGESPTHHDVFTYTADGTSKELVNFGVGNNAARVTIRNLTNAGSWITVDVLRKTNTYENILVLDTSAGESDTDVNGVTITPEGITSYDAGLANTDLNEYLVIVDYGTKVNTYTNQPYNVDTSKHVILNFPNDSIVSKQKIGNTYLEDGVVKGDNILFTNVGDTAEAVVIYEKAQSTTAENDAYLVCYIDTATGLPVTTNDDNIVVDFTDKKIFGLGV